MTGLVCGCGGRKKAASAICRTCYLASPPTQPLERLWAGVDRSAGPNGCWTWTGLRDRHGYGHISVGRRKESTHRLAYRLAVGVIPDGLNVLHRCDNPPCCNPAHLFVGTQATNLRDMAAKQRSGQRRTKVTAEQIAAIRAWVPAAGERQSDLAATFGVSRRLVGMIRRGERRRTAV